MLVGVKMPPDDDSVWPALWLLFISALFTAAVLALMWAGKSHVQFVPPSSTLAPLEP